METFIATDGAALDITPLPNAPDTIEVRTRGVLLGRVGLGPVLHFSLMAREWETYLDQAVGAWRARGRA